MSLVSAALAVLLASRSAANPAPSFVSEAELGAAVAAAATQAKAAADATPRGVAAVGGVEIETLFAFAVRRGGYEAWCRDHGCRPSAVIVVEPSEHVRKDHNGWYNGGNSYIKDRPNTISLEITAVHELTHHLQRLSNRYHQYRGICNQYLAEKEAYESGEAYAKSKGYTTRHETRLAPYEKKCRDAVAAGLVKAPASLTL